MNLAALKLVLMYSMNCTKIKVLFDFLEIPYAPYSRQPTKEELYLLTKTALTAQAALNCFYYLDTIPLTPSEEQELQSWINASQDYPIQAFSYSTHAQGSINSLNYLQSPSKYRMFNN